MIGRLLAVGALLAAAGSASGAVVTNTTDVGAYRINLSGAPATPVHTTVADRATALVYADWTGAPGGSGALNGVLTTGLNRLDGDRVNTLPNGVNLLSDMGYSFGNNNPSASTARISSFAANINFFDGVTQALIGGFTGAGANLAGLPGGGLAGNSSVRLSFGAGVLEFLNILLPTDVIFTVTITSVTFTAGTGNDPNLIGQQIRNPVSIGSSSDQLVLNGAVVNDPLGTGPDGNFSLYLITNSIPTPATAGLLALGGLVATRRRR